VFSPYVPNLMEPLTRSTDELTA